MGGREVAGRWHRTHLAQISEVVQLEGRILQGRHACERAHTRPVARRDVNDGRPPLGMECDCD